ncbi:deoxynucleotidyltransferase terminal-interacting protein 2-like [Saccostrea echinata]|uniref:deoxynucleotidyltransferase terminal-interacting protein 2-like n=1 Tax=Saccostrea echinata TaxID=191078 RepID=UPI002A8301C2|nr:deoxynucleotidyltransferase terminal-interacting protein 2-like [Saccostrea echinata]
MKHNSETYSSSSEDESSSDEELKEVAFTLSESIAQQLSKRQERCSQVDNSIFVLDKRPGNISPNLSPKKDQGKEKLNETSKSNAIRKKKKKNYDGLSSYIHSNINLMDPSSSKLGTSQKRRKNKEKDTNKSDRTVQEIMKKSIIKPDFEKQDSLEPYEESLRKLKQKRKKEREMTKGKGWFGMRAPEMTDEAKMNLEVLKMRKALDPKRFYKGNDMKGLPKFFQFGKVVESAADFYHSRVPKKKRKANLVQELIADAEFRKFNKRKYVEIQEAKMKGEGPYKRMKRPKKKKK